VARVKMIPPDSASGTRLPTLPDLFWLQWGKTATSRVCSGTKKSRRALVMCAAERRHPLINVKADPDYVKIQQLVIIKT